MWNGHCLRTSFLPLLGSGSEGRHRPQRAHRAVQANLVAALTTVVLSRGIRVGVVRRTRCAATCQEAVAKIFADLPARAEKRLFSVDAGIATIAQFRAATAQDALVGQLRKNVTLRRAPAPQRPGKRGRPALHGRCCIRGQAPRRTPRQRPDDLHRRAGSPMVVIKLPHPLSLS